MRSDQFDLIIVGGGLAGSLLLQALRTRHPKLRILLLEQRDQLGGDRTWSFHEADLPPTTKEWLEPLISHSWNGYDVHFPEYSRTLTTAFHSLQPHDVSEKLLRDSPHSIRLNESVARIEKSERYKIHLASGPVVETETIIFARGWAGPNSPVAWQKYVGLEVELEEPHELERVVLMDARVAQIDGFRFFQILPFEEKRLLIEDTYYSHHTGLKAERIEREVFAYLTRQNWKVKSLQRRQVGTLPLIMSLGKNPDQDHREIPRIGAESGFFHPVAGAAVPTLLRQIAAVTDHSNLTMPSILRELKKVEADAKNRLRYDRLLNRMMFQAAEPTKRYKVLSHFYKMPEPLIQRFYGGQISFLDQLRLLLGRPPVSLKKALRVLREDEPHDGSRQSPLS
jgi:lycopene beta-cyclase